MATYTPQQLGINASTTGGQFKQGAWYNGRQYWNGTLSDPGVVHPESNQPGAGQQVSQEVIQQTNPNNLAYVQAERQKANLSPISSSQPSFSPGSMPGGSSYGSAGSTPGAFTPTQTTTIDLPSMYQKIYDESGISDIERDLSEKEKRYNEVMSGINDNPFLSEARRLGRQQKLSTDYENSIASLKNDVATKKADIDMKLQLQTKQFDINNQQAQQAMQQFNTLLNAGALDGASGEDIANITRSTGLSSNMILSAINRQKEGQVKPQVVTSTDDSGNVTYTVIDERTGNIINQSSLGQIGKADKTSGGAGGISATKEREYTGKAISILQQVDQNYQTVNGKIKKLRKAGNGDNRLSEAEGEYAFNKILAEVGDKNLALQIFQTAFQTGGFTVWKN